MKGYGNLVNRIMEDCKSVEPTVGMGCTEVCYSDRHAYTVIEIRRNCNGKVHRCTVQRDKVTRVDKNGMSDSQTWSCESDPNGAIVALKLSRKGQWKGAGSVFIMGTRDEYYDFSF